MRWAMRRVRFPGEVSPVLGGIRAQPTARAAAAVPTVLMKSRLFINFFKILLLIYKIE